MPLEINSSNFYKNKQIEGLAGTPLDMKGNVVQRFVRNHNTESWGMDYIGEVDARNPMKFKYGPVKLGVTPGMRYNSSSGDARVSLNVKAESFTVLGWNVTFALEFRE